MSAKAPMDMRNMAIIDSMASSNISFLYPLNMVNMAVE